MLPNMDFIRVFSKSEIKDDARNYAVNQGIAVKCKDGTGYRMLPLTLFPSEINREQFHLAQEMQVPIQVMIDNISRDHAFLESSVGQLAKVDPFLDNLYHIYQTVQKQGIASSYSLGIFRSDYIIDDSQQLKQVEMNTISVSFAGIAPKIANFHKYTLKNYRMLSSSQINQAIPNNSSLDDVAQALVEAHRAYPQNSNAAILVVIEENVLNVMDQKMIEWKVKANLGNTGIYRRTFREMDGAILLGSNKELILTLADQSQVEISVVYFRTAYTTNDFLYENSWSIRLLIEQSKAIKCPSIQNQLAGLKKIQTLLSKPDIFERFSPSHSVDLNKKTYETFVKFWDIGNDSLRIVSEDPNRYVLKPNLEGGGNNYFGTDIISKTKEIIEARQNAAYFLMEFINQPSVENIILRSESTGNEWCSLIKNELGIFGTILASREGSVVANHMAGHLLRSKTATSNEAGIMSGGGILDSPFLV